MDLTRAATPIPETTAGRRTRPRTAGWLRRPAFALLAAAVVIGAVAVGRMRLPQEPLAEYGILPGPGAGQDTALGGGAGGPGFTFVFEYELGGALAAGWPTLPPRAPTYRRQPYNFTEARAAALAARLGIDAPVVREGWHDSYVLAADPGNGGPSLRMYPVGYVVYTQPYDYAPVQRDQLPADARAIAVARQWLSNADLVPAAELGPASVRPELENGLLYVWFTPAEPTDVVSRAPWAQVVIGVGEKVVTGSAVWYNGESGSIYPLRPVAEAWQAVRVGEAQHEWDVVEYPGPADDSGVVEGMVTLVEVRLAWSLALADDGTPYLVPVYAFRGTVEVPSGEGMVTLPFQVWAAAVEDRLVQVQR